jgi:hypothetical protein
MLTTLRVEDAVTAATVGVRTYASPRVAHHHRRLIDDVFTDRDDGCADVVLRLRVDAFDKENIDPTTKTMTMTTFERRRSRGACTPSRPPLVDITHAAARVSPVRVCLN